MFLASEKPNICSKNARLSKFDPVGVEYLGQKF